MKKYLDMFSSFFIIGALTFGGGYAMLPLLEREVVDKRRWATPEELLDCFSIGQCCPGVIAANVATMIGFRQYGRKGAIVATAGVIFPSLIIILLIARLLDNISHLAAVQHAFGGIRVAVCVLILSAILKLWKPAIVDNLALIICLAAFLITVLTGISPIWTVIGSAVCGILLKKAAAGRETK